MIRRRKDLTWFLDEIHEARKDSNTSIILAFIGSVLVVIGMISSLVLYLKRR